MWAKELGTDNVIIEGNPKLVVDGILNGVSQFSVFGDYIRASIHLLNFFQHIKVIFVRRGVNLLAHELARSSIVYGSSHSWSDPPTIVDRQTYTSCHCNNMS